MEAIFTSSPEYNFEFKELNDYKCELLIKGVDRYHKITHSLQIAGLLKWSVVKPFYTGHLRDYGTGCFIGY